MVVLKFGGTSVGNNERMDNSLSIAVSQLDNAPVMVASAMSKITDSLQEIAYRAGDGKREEAERILKAIKDRHLETANGFLTEENLKNCNKNLETIFEELESIIVGLSILKQWTKRTNDAILSFGERLSTTILYYRALERGVDAQLIDAREIIKTDDNFTGARPIENLTNQKINELVKPERGKLIITQGFIASTVDGITTTLGRGGSDYTATIVGAALSVDEVQIWTDVTGIMTCDPRVVPEAKTLPEISYREAQELAYFGAKVIHPSTIQPAVERGIPVVVKNTGDPEAAGTRIIGEEDGKGIKAIAFKSGITVVNIVSSRMLLAYGFLRKIFEIFENHKTSVDLISTSEVSVSMTLDDTSELEGIVKDLSEIGRVSVEKNNTIISLVGSKIWRNPRVLSDVFMTLKEVPVRMVSLGSSEVNLSFVVPDERAKNTVRMLHEKFFGK